MIEYRARWREALVGDLTEANIPPRDIEDVVASQLTDLPDGDELAKLRAIYAIVELLLFDSPWPRAFTAADEARQRCATPR